MPELTSVALALDFLFVFAIGASVGSFLNVIAYRLPYERSFLWPGSHCGSCFQPIRWYDNLPLVSYWVLRGRCRTCGARFSVRYFLVELGTGLAFAGLFYLEVYRNALGIRELANHHWGIERGFIPLVAWEVFFYHATLMSFLIAASICDIDHLEIPLGITVAGTVVGLVGSACFPWPFPNSPGAVPAPVPAGNFLVNPQAPEPGLYPWPVWSPLPAWLPPGSWQLGLATGLAGAVLGNVVLRAVAWLFRVGRGIEGLGIGDADLMMMAGSFVGWQVTLVAFGVGVFPALFFGLGQVVFRGRQAMPFGPSLAVGVMITLLCWQQMAGRAWVFLSDSFMLGFFGVVGPLLFLSLTLGLRILRGGAPPDEGDEKKGSA